MLQKAAWGQAGDREVMIPGRDEVKGQGHRSKFRGQCHRSKVTGQRSQVKVQRSRSQVKGYPHNDF